jgi:hypothetical protein
MRKIVINNKKQSVLIISVRAFSLRLAIFALIDRFTASEEAPCMRLKLGSWRYMLTALLNTYPKKNDMCAIQYEGNTFTGVVTDPRGVGIS